ncbi:hypothetical protein A1O7_04666 [Cladophialophora yegresii CBS 114405]|uniref:Uncharacterized protein n=1 Tax=Cladophialophora yegresii CBS 114405 TaxID=1182544 RepID=W9VXX1_9EURO|nr:uncharacterized protein A1O7_04666 [Cladophialophora yegresii CBS 114405]EXJ60513.1 hypothetical protein A1O7_04666 [Cladophialophora yegresii CBS 114405]
MPTSLDASWLQTPATPRPAPTPKPKDRNAPDYRYQVNQKCIYERRLPGGSYITAHVQRLQSGYYDSPSIHEDCIDHVRFVAINFVFHPSRTTFRFKSAEIRIALRHTGEDDLSPSLIVTDLVPLPLRTNSHSHDHATQTVDTTHDALVRSKDCGHGHGCKPSRPRFLRHAPHLLYGSISPETLNWNFNLAGSLGVSQGPASASLKPSYGVKSSYKVYEMMKIQGSVRTLRGGNDYDIEDGELVWTLEENRLQKSGLPREFTFVMLLTKRTGPLEESGDVRLEVDVHPKVTGRMGTTYPSVVTNLHQYQPFKGGTLDLDEEIGQVFEPHVRGKGFNFADIASSFDDFVWLPGNAYSTSEPEYSAASGGGQQQQQQQQQERKQQGAPAQQQTAQQGDQRQKRQYHPHGSAAQNALPSADTTLNLRVFFDPPSRNSPVPFLSGPQQQQHRQQIPYLNLEVPRTRSQNPWPVKPSIGESGARNLTTRRTITIGSGSGAGAGLGSGSGLGSSKSVRKQRSRSEVAREYRSPSEQRRAEVAKEYTSSPE